jgi:hypothetical protein
MTLVGGFLPAVGMRECKLWLWQTFFPGISMVTAEAGSMPEN